MIPRYVRLFARFALTSLQRDLEYRLNLVINILDSVFWLVISVVFFSVLYTHVDTVAGWNLYQTLFLVGTDSLIFSIAFGLWILNLGDLPVHIQMGDLDGLLLKPVNSQFLASSRYIYYGAIANILAAAPVLAYALAHLDVDITLGAVLLYLVLVANGVVLIYAMWAIFMTMSFWTIRIQALHGFYLSLIGYARYPADIFPGALRIVFLFAVPIVVISNFPVQMLLGWLDPAWAIYAFGLSALLLWLSTRVWKLGLRQYNSASS